MAANNLAPHGYDRYVNRRIISVNDKSRRPEHSGSVASIFVRAALSIVTSHNSKRRQCLGAGLNRNLRTSAVHNSHEASGLLFDCPRASPVNV